MRIETKFDLGDTVYPIYQGCYLKPVDCGVCGGKGRITIVETDVKRLCPECYGKGGSQKWVNDKWKVRYGETGRIGKVTCERYSSPNEDDHIDKNRYMLDSTGIGSGSLWSEDRLFLTKEEAVAKCKQLNNEGVVKDELL